ncbi:acyl carrier protein [Shouchella patagoniensis]|uniref:acyl carrier protein n=1 Tax=Shouchella patagoniensis TaxID=228576 RepID=UPI000994B4D2|nr:acyl carrier protein [Shouchella patagoniensis]
MKNRERLVALIEEVLEIEDENVNLQSNIKELEAWDSVNALRILTNVEADFNVRLNMKDFLAAKTVEEIFRLIEVQHV